MAFKRTKKMLQRFKQRVPASVRLEKLKEIKKEHLIVLVLSCIVTIVV